MFRIIGIVLLCLLALADAEGGDRVRISDIELHYTVHGDGPSVLLLHGYSSTGQDSWKSLIPEMAKSFRVYVLDLRGHGQSTHSERPFTHQLVAQDVVEFLDHLKIPKTSAIGASSGANVLLHLATKAPDRLDAMVLVACGHYMPEEARAILGGDQLRETFLTDQRMSELHPNGRGQWEYIRGNARALSKNFTDMTFTPPLLKTIKTRTLIMHGDRDEFFPINIPFELYNSLPNSQLWILPARGHNLIYPPGANPQIEREFVNRVTQFLTTTEPSDKPQSR